MRVGKWSAGLALGLFLLFLLFWQVLHQRAADAHASEVAFHLELLQAPDLEGEARAMVRARLKLDAAKLRNSLDMQLVRVESTGREQDILAKADRQIEAFRELRGRK